MHSNDRTINNYTLEQELANSFLSDVWKGRDKNGNPVAIKINHYNIDKIAKRIAALPHPNLLVPIDVFTYERRTITITPFLDKPWTTLVDVNHEWNSADAKHIMLQVADGLAQLHDHNIAHLDIERKNIFINPKTLETKLFDFNTSREPYVQKSPYVTFQEVPPEHRAGGAIGLPSDIWQISRILRDLTYRATYKFNTIAHHPKKNTPREYVDIITKGMNPAQEHRYQHARDFYDALREAPDKVPTKKSLLSKIMTNARSAYKR